ncbi:uncharacterized protein [Rutidosis leptorrhynchoides]|uniref:uncharacterized protein isoform X2 n=1 Tax=Rutidosis leptorrhynchoides TaxID=125765 RepID=UPI003A996C68
MLKKNSLKFCQGLHSRVSTVGVTIPPLQCILFHIRLIALSNSASAPILKPFRRTLVGALFQHQWLKFHIMALIEEFKWKYFWCHCNGPQAESGKRR